MPTYPFDQHFSDTFERIFEDDSTWALQNLFYYKNEEFVAEIFEKLGKCGFAETTVRHHLDVLERMAVDDLFELAVTENGDFCPAYVFLQLQKSREVFDALSIFCSDANPMRRATAIEIMMRFPGATFKSEATKIICDIADFETNELVWEALAYALAHLEVRSRSKYLAKWCTSIERDTRFAVAYSLGRLSTKAAIKSLVLLSQDSDDEVRSWSVCGLGSLTDLDTIELRAALVARMDDPHEETRHEAILGLAKRRDMRVLAALKKALEDESIWDMALKSAAELAAPELLPQLLELQNGFDSVYLERAIEACRAAEQ